MKQRFFLTTQVITDFSYNSIPISSTICDYENAVFLLIPIQRIKFGRKEV